MRYIIVLLDIEILNYLIHETSWAPEFCTAKNQGLRILWKGTFSLWKHISALEDVTCISFCPFHQAAYTEVYISFPSK